MYKIKLSHFEGPLDLLLFFIKRDELDIYDIPISKITRDFISYLEIFKELDLESAGEFILMASTLMQIKARMLLPREVDEKGDEIDPRADLVNALIEYKRYKEISEEMGYLESNQRKLAFRGYFEEDPKEKPPELDTLLKNITIYDLLLAFKKAMTEMPVEPVHKIRKINISLDEQITYILNKVKIDEKVSFGKLIVEMKEKIRVIITFIAMLELIKMGKIGLRENIELNEFEIYGFENG